MPLATQSIPVIPISPGIAIGRIQQLAAPGGDSVTELRRILPADCDAEFQRFEAGRTRTREELKKLSEQLVAKIGKSDADIFVTQTMLLDDRAFISLIKEAIQRDLCCAENAVQMAVCKLRAAFSGLADDYIKERAADIRDVGGRLVRNISGAAADPFHLEHQRIIVAPSLNPSDTIRLDREMVLGFAIETGSTTSHAAILARSMSIPAVAGLPAELLEKLTSEDTLIVDGFSGRLIVNPDEATIEIYSQKRAQAGKLTKELKSESDLMPETRDGFRVKLLANLENAADFDEALKLGAEGVGLFRTEFLFMEEKLPDEDTQFEIYKQLLIKAGDLPVTVRTMDLGGDKFSRSIRHRRESNPYLGLRGVRLSIYERRDLFNTQLRALLRAGVYGKLRVMLPMVSSITEIRKVRDIISSLQQRLERENLEYLRKISLGAMVETPAAALIADQLAEEVDFFSIGTNDLIQYTMACDRGNDRVAYLYRPSHPAVLHLIGQCAMAAARHNIPVCVCGQMAGDPLMTPILLGLGVNSMSMDSESLPMVRHVLRNISFREAEILAAEARKCRMASEALDLAQKLVKRCAPEIFRMRSDAGDSPVEPN